MVPGFERVLIVQRYIQKYLQMKRHAAWGERGCRGNKINHELAVVEVEGWVQGLTRLSLSSRVTTVEKPHCQGH